MKKAKIDFREKSVGAFRALRPTSSTPAYDAQGPRLSDWEGRGAAARRVGARCGTLVFVDSNPLDDVVERRIQDAEAAGLFRNLPGAGRPIEVEDLSRVPEELRGGYILLKNAGVLPEELELRQSVLRLDDLLAACEDEERRAVLGRERALAALRLSMLRERRGLGPAHDEYAAQLATRLGGRTT